MIEVKHVVKSFDGGEPVLKDISAVFEAGKVNMIIGPSGSGKTVLLKSIIGLHRVDCGRIEYDGRNLPDMRMKDIRLLRREVGMLFQGSALFDSRFTRRKQNLARSTCRAGGSGENISR